MVSALAAALAVGTVIWALFYYQTYAANKRRLQAVIEFIFASGSVSPRLTSRIGNLFDQSPFGIRVNSFLEKNHIRILPFEYVVYMGTIFLSVGWILINVIGMGTYAAFLFSGILGLSLQRWWTRARNRKIRIRLQKQFPEICRLLANSLRAGLTVSQAIEVLSRELPSPANREMQTMLKDILLGVEMESVFASFQRRVQIQEADLFARILLIQHTLGGNLAGVLDDMARTMEERFLLQRSLRSMTAEAKYIAYILPFVPVLLLIMMNYLINGFLAPLFTLPGMLIVGSFVFVQAVAFLIIKKIVNFKV